MDKLNPKTYRIHKSLDILSEFLQGEKVTIDYRAIKRSEDVLTELENTFKNLPKRCPNCKEYFERKAFKEHKNGCFKNGS